MGHLAQTSQKAGREISKALLYSIQMLACLGQWLFMQLQSGFSSSQ